VPKTVHPTCVACGARLYPGVQHLCVTGNAAKPNLDWLKWVAFALQFFVLFGTIMWKASAMQNDLQYMKQQQEKDERTLGDIQKYFQKPYDAGQSNWRTQ
jgi:hypothetical protein